MTITSDIRALIEQPSPTGIIDLSDHTLTEDLDVRVTRSNVLLHGLNLADNCRLNLRQANGWTVSGVTGRGSMSMLGGNGWVVDQVHFADTACMAQMGVAWDEVFGQRFAPTNWTIRDSTFRRQSMDGPAKVGTYQTTVHQNTGLYVHTVDAVRMNGLVSGCVFEDHPYGSNIKLGPTGTYDGYCLGVRVADTTLMQRGGKGTNLLLPGYGDVRLDRVVTGDGNLPERVISTNGPTHARIGVSCEFKGGNQYVTLSKRYISLGWFGGFWATGWPWYTPHTLFDVAPVSARRSVEGIVWETSA